MNPQLAPLQTLPVDFDGVFRFTNWTDEDFISKWDGKTYTFPALKTVPIIIPTLSPLEIQNVRKKFAKELAEREFSGSKRYKELDAKNKGENMRTFHAAVTYTPNELEPLVQKCLEPLPVAKMEVKDTPKVEIKPKATRRLKSKLSDPNETDESLIRDGQVVA